MSKSHMFHRYEKCLYLLLLLQFAGVVTIKWCDTTPECVKLVILSFIITIRVLSNTATVCKASKFLTQLNFTRMQIRAVKKIPTFPKVSSNGFFCFI